jgi:hypothetical protein
MALEKDQMSHRWEKPSMPLNASAFRYSGSKTMVDFNSSTRPLCRGMPNLVGKELCILAMIFMGTVSDMAMPSCGKTYYLQYTGEGTEWQGNLFRLCLAGQENRDIIIFTSKNKPLISASPY